MSTAPIKPAQLKSYLGAARDYLATTTQPYASSSSSPEQFVSDLSSACQALLCLELVQRGVLLKDDHGGCRVPFDSTPSNSASNSPPNSDDDDQVRSILDSVTSTAGRSLLDADSHSLPKPMLAASNAVMAMAAERCAELVDELVDDLMRVSDDSIADIEEMTCRNVLICDHVSLVGSVGDGGGGGGDDDAKKRRKEEAAVVEKKFDSAIKRCGDVNDTRLTSLLELSQHMLCPKPNASGGPGSQSGPSQHHQHHHQQSKLQPSEIITHLRTSRTILLRIAAGQYMRAAVQFSGEDQPQMWKRCLDAVLKLDCNLQKVRQQVQQQEGGSGDNGGDDYGQYATIEAAQPLSNLIRIAAGKGNDKRVSELSLRLVESYLAGIEEAADANSSSGGGSSGSSSSGIADGLVSLSTTIKEEFWDKYHSSPVSSEDADTSSKAKAKLANMAQDAFAKVNLSLVLSNSDLTDFEKEKLQLLYRVLSLRTKLAIEQSQINIMAEENWTAVKNRAAERDGGVGRGGIVGLAKSKKQKAREEDLSLERFVKEANQAILLDDYSTVDGGDGIDAAALALRDEAISAIAQGSDAICKLGALLDAAFELVERQIERLTERARSVAIVVSKPKKKKATKEWDQVDSDRAWSLVASFAGPVLLSLGEEQKDKETSPASSFPILDAMSKLGRQSICTAAVASISARWMILTEEEQSISIDLASSILSQCKEMNTKEDEEEDRTRKLLGEDAIGAAEVSKYSSKYLVIDAAISAAECRSGLALAGDDDSKIGKHIRNATVSALKWEKKITSKRQKDLLSKVGAPFLQFLLAWCGLHRSPWSFCTVTQARSIVGYAKESFEDSVGAWGRSPTPLEQILLQLGEADVEYQLPGGYVPDGEILYQKVLSTLEDPACSIEGSVLALLKAHCLVGLARISLMGISSSDSSSLMTADEYARDSLDTLAISLEDGTTVHLSEWRNPNAFKGSASFHVCAARQLVAEYMIRDSRPDDARLFLEEAVKDAPLDYDAAFALGAFRLRMVLMEDNPSNSEKKKAQTQLLKAAKLNSKKADPFALLGLWYELQKDDRRAVGCFSKALLLDPTHPVAGRGMLRMKPFEEVKHLCNTASSLTSPVNGWSWRALGIGKGLDEGDDESAAICFQQALRCRDIQAHSNESLGFFYSLHMGTKEDRAKITSFGECAETWSILAGCYRRLGKFSASLRAYNSANDASNGIVDPATLCAWAHVELELGLAEEAVNKFESVLAESIQSSSSAKLLALYGHGIAMAALSRTHASEGKFRSALAHLQKGIKSVQELIASNERRSHAIAMDCAYKLLGDLHTYGSSLGVPASLFESSNANADNTLECCSCTHDKAALVKLAFVSRGERAYRMVLLEDEIKLDDPGLGSPLHIAAAAFDLGTNLLCQAQILASSLGEGSGGGTKTSLMDMPLKCSAIRERIERSIEEFRKAIEWEEFFAPAWCGLGVALCYQDVLLAQHCFCRAVQIDKASPENWSNLGLVYADRGVVKASEEALDALTQVADTPFMWIGRALLLEDESAASAKAVDSSLSRASDAYRAALQVAHHPTALLGLSLTSRRLGLSKVMEEQNAVYSESAHTSSMHESHLAVSMHLHLSGPYNVGARALDSLNQSEDAAERFSIGDISVGKEILGGSGSVLSVDDTAKLLEELTLGDAEEEYKCSDTGEEIGLLLERSSQATEAVRAIEQSATSSVDADIDSKQENHGLAAARLKVRLHPDNGEYFLDFAKELAKEYTAADEPCAYSRSAVSSAAERASSLLLDQVTNVHMIAPRRPIILEQGGEGAVGPGAPEHDLSMHKNVVPMVADAEVLSESLALKAWLPVPTVEGSDNEDEGAAASAKKDASAQTESVVNLHRSLLLDPENMFARSLLEAL